ncbi:glycosyltransferase [Pseudomonas fluorescens]|uniref:glycosyltransferase n=1 Tax=Pseudomonas fluorescens TaxID=294 RepID=UPI001783ACB3|nr:glycosyltransferase [Pseudomonas fluorescens]MBD8227671.1 glycosyltransferase [Pseudomonas fluorescens]MBD8785637.1 glycosyltransferase [Pseudomonas fluorescens]MBD8817866.1 glycosyltransferase [Pseudomonas fluorescens]
MKDQVVLSIITISYNSAGDGLERTIASIVEQKDNSPLIEYIVIDGGSTDDSHEIYSRYRSRIDFFTSERDKGISDAFNKGVRAANGKYLWFINAGDYPSSGSMSYMLSALQSEPEGILYGDMYWVKSDGEQLELRAAEDYAKKINYVMPFMHPSTIVSSEVFESIGLFDSRLKRAMDYDLLLRAYRYGFRAKKLNRVLSHMTAGGVHDVDYGKTVFEVFKVAYFSNSGLVKPFMAMIYTYLCQRSPIFNSIKRLLRAGYER